MTPAARIMAITEILQEYENSDRPLDRICDMYFRARRFIGGGDRRFIGDLVYKITRHQIRLDWWIAKGDADVTPTARMRAIAALVFLDKWDEAQIFGAFTDEKYSSGVLSEAEKKWISRWVKSPPQLLSADMDNATRLECPEWMLGKIQESFPDRWQEILLEMQKEASVDLRVNILRAPRQDVFDRLKPLLEELEQTPYSPIGLRLKTRANLGNLDALKDGTIEV